MKLVPVNENIDERKLLIENLLQQSDPEVKKISLLDQTMKSILDSSLDEDSKFKLYKQTLNKLLSIKNFMANNLNNNRMLIKTPSISPSKSKILNPSPSQNLLTPNLTLQTSVYSTPSSKSPSNKKTNPHVSSVKQRRVKKQAIRRIKEFYQNEDTDSEEQDSWKRYNSPKSFRRIKK